MEQIMYLSQKPNAKNDSDGDIEPQNKKPKNMNELTNISFETKESRDALFDAIGRDLFLELCGLAVERAVGEMEEKKKAK